MNPYLKELQRCFEWPRKYAWLNMARISAFAAEAAPQALLPPSWREPVYPENDLEFVESLGQVDTINFCFADIETGEKFQTLWPECKRCRQDIALYQETGKRKFCCKMHGVEAELWSGAFAMVACMRRAIEDGIPISTPEFLRCDRWTIELARFVFRGIPPLSVIPMLEERREFLRMSAVSLEKYGDSWMNLFREASFRAFNNGSGVVERLAGEFPSYFDEYNSCPGNPDMPIPFFKRAHLFVQMYEGRARTSSVLPRIQDPELLILPADYQLPRVFRAIGVLEYSPELLDTILRRKEIREGSRAEIEIRLATVEAGEILEREMNEFRRASLLPLYTKVELDYLLWTKGRECKEPHHLTRTTKY